MSIRLLLLVSLSIIAQTGYSQKHIAIIGSSSAAGYFPATSGFPKDSAWAYKVKKYYKDLGIIDTIINLGQSSTTCFEGMPSSFIPPAGFNYPLPNPAINITKAVNLIPKPDVIIVNYPSNGYDWIANEQILSCLQTIKDSANIKNIKCYITTTQPRDGFSPSERLKLKTLRDLILNQFGDFAIDFFTDITQEPALTIKTEYAIGDLVHLNPGGHTVLKNKVLEKNIFFGVVPVKFTDWYAVSQADKIVLQWKTIFETNHLQFIIETSTDGIHFVPLVTVPGKNNSSTLQQYFFTHLTPSQGENFYRLVAVSLQGQKEYSAIALAKFKNKLNNNVAITYTNNQVNLSFTQMLKKPVVVTILNMQGTLILNRKIEAIHTLVHRVNTPDLPAGKYIVQVIFEDHKETAQFVKL
jgi:lysophospholipase L1-like esterase